jgi:hypothetical protein
MNENFATKADIKELDLTISALAQKMDLKFEQMEYRLTIKLGSFLVIAIGAMSAVMRLLGNGHG